MDKESFREREKLVRITRELDRDLEAVVVEGYSDKKVLEQLGFTGKIFLSAERENELLAEDIERGADTVGILTDFDSHGKKQSRELLKLLEDKVDVLKSSRKKFGKQLTSEGRRAVEDARPLLHSKQKKFVDAALDDLFIGSGN